MTTSGWVHGIVSNILGGSPFEIGDIVLHPSGRTVKIIDGEYLDSVYGRLSNYWSWREVLENGELSETTEHGYGWKIKVDVEEANASTSL